jgi:hypothetical protein
MNSQPIMNWLKSANVKAAAGIIRISILEAQLKEEKKKNSES